MFERFLLSEEIRKEAGVEVLKNDY